MQQQQDDAATADTTHSVTGGGRGGGAAVTRGERGDDDGQRVGELVHAPRRLCILPPRRLPPLSKPAHAAAERQNFGGEGRGMACVKCRRGYRRMLLQQQIAAAATS